jgi:5'-methylthioadenosine phosphorylase
MTALPEAKLAREAEICYASIACVTDYDSWQEEASLFTVDDIMDILHKNSDSARKIIKLAVTDIPEKRDCGCAAALQNAILTAPKFIQPKQRQRLDLLIGKYLKGDR